MSCLCIFQEIEIQLTYVSLLKEEAKVYGLLIETLLEIKKMLASGLSGYFLGLCRYWFFADLSILIIADMPTAVYILIL